MFDIIVQIFFLLIWNILVSFFTITARTIVFILQNIKVAFIISIILLIILILLIVLFIFTWLFVNFWYHADQMIKQIINLIFITAWNGFTRIRDLLVPILGRINETFLVAGSAFLDYFCPEKVAGVCLRAERFWFLLQNFAYNAAIFVELIIIQYNAYITLVFEFICDMAVYAPEYESFFCFLTPLRRQYIDRVISNDTLTYVDRNLYDHIIAVMSVVGSFAKFMVREGLDYFGRTLIFLGAEFLIILQYAAILGIVVFAFLLTVLTGIIYSSAPPNLPDLNSTVPLVNANTTFLDVYDIMQTRLTAELLQLNPFRFYNESEYPCPPGVCELYENILIQTNSTLHNIYTNIPILFMVVDAVMCGIINIHLCGEDLGICDFFFSLEFGILQKGIEFLLILIHDTLIEVDAFELIADDLVYLGYDSAEDASYALLTPVRELCSLFANQGACPCWACEIDPGESIIFNIFDSIPFTKKFGALLKKYVPCVIFSQPPKTLVVYPEENILIMIEIVYHIREQLTNRFFGIFMKWHFLEKLKTFYQENHLGVLIHLDIISIFLRIVLVRQNSLEIFFIVGILVYLR